MTCSMHTMCCVACRHISLAKLPACTEVHPCLRIAAYASRTACQPRHVRAPILQCCSGVWFVSGFLLKCKLGNVFAPSSVKEALRGHVCCLVVVLYAAQRYIYMAFPSETLTRSGYNIKRKHFAVVAVKRGTAYTLSASAR